MADPWYEPDVTDHDDLHSDPLGVPRGCAAILLIYMAVATIALVFLMVTR